VIRSLLPHPTSCSSAELWHLETRLETNQSSLEITYQIRGDVTQIEIPESQFTPRRSDHLWQNTCCEIFLRRPNHGNTYLEFNFAPSGHWAFYRLSGYRAKLERPDIQGSPHIATRVETGEISLKATIPWAIIKAHLPETSSLEAGLAVILREKSGAMAYWAVKHPSEQPDFHHPDSFFTL